MKMSKQKIPNIPYGPYAAVIVGAVVNGRPTYTTVGAYGVVSQRPVLYVSVKNTHYITPGIRESGFFSVNVPNAAHVAETDLCGMVSGGVKDKSGVFTAFYDAAGGAPLAGECPVNYLCRVVRSIPVYDFTMFLGEIVAAYAEESCLSGGRPDAARVDPILMMDTGYFRLRERIGGVFRSGREPAEKL